MRRGRLGALGALITISVVAASTGVAPAAPPAATASHAFVAGSPAAISCGGSVDARVTLNTQAGTTGASTDVMLVLDLSGSIGSPATKFTDLKRAATDTLDALDAADGTVDQAIAGNAVGIVYYRNGSATPVASVGASYNTLLSAINALPAPTGSSPHNLGIDLGAAGLAASTTGYAKSIVLVSDGQAAGQELTDSSNSASNARASGIRIVPVGIGTGGDVSQANLESWASQASYYQAGTPGSIDRTKLVTDLNAAVAVPTSFTVTETLGARFGATPLSNSAGTVTTGPGSLTWSGTLAGAQTATLVFRATRNGTDVFAATNEVVSTLSLAVSGGTATVTPPAALSIDVLPCGATPIATTTCTGASCTAAGTAPGGVQYTVNAGSPPSGTTVVLAALNTPAPPAGACPGFVPRTRGAQFDIRPLSTSVNLRIVIPRASLGSTRWFQTDICMGTNLRFTTAIESLANLRPGATLVGGGALPGRWYGLLPSLPRLVFIPGLGFRFGPWITSRLPGSDGSAIINIQVPFVPGSAGFTTDGQPGYDPKTW
jgi:von Willebrand factor type A domain